MRLNLSLGALASLQLLASFAYQLAVLALVGAGPSTDAWVAAQAVPAVLFALLVGVIQGTWQGRFAATGPARGEWLRLQRTASGQVWLLCIPAFIVLATTSKWWVDIAFVGLNADQVELATRLSLPLLAATIMNSQSALATAALRGRDRFIACEVITLVVATASIAAVIVLIPIHGIVSAAWVTLARAAVLAITLFCISGRPWPSVKMAIGDSVSWRAATPLLSGGFIYKSGPLVDRIFSSMAPVGGMTVFNLAQMGVSAIGVVLERAMTTPLTPRIARLANESQWELVASAVRTNLLRGLLAPLAAATCVLALSPWWVTIAQVLLNLDLQQARESWKICLVFALLLYPLSVGATVVSTFYAIGDTKTIARVGVAGFLLSLLVKYFSFKAGGLVGLAAGICIYYLVNFLAMALLLRAKLRLMRQGCKPRK